MEAIEILVKEHDSILKVIEITEKILGNNNSRDVNINHVENIIDFIQNFADKYHHLKEEDVLFMEMGRNGMSKESGPISVMLAEHNEGRNYVQNALKAVEKYKAGDADSFEQIKDQLLNYCELLTNHIYKENNILYPMAERLLPDNLKVEIAEEFENSQKSTLNNEYFDKYMKLVEDYSELYLK